MGRDKRSLANLNEDVRLHILSFCGVRDALSLMRINRTWYSSYKITRVWKPIYYNSCNDFNPKPICDNSHWLREIKKKVGIYGPNFDKYRHLLGNVKIRWKIDPPVQLGAGRHIHKKLGLYIDGRLLPCMGYGGPSEVCFRDWIVEVFTPLIREFDSNEIYTYRWDFCDQAMPEFVFVKNSSPICKLSICDGICGGKADPNWQNIEFLIEDLRVEYIKFLEELYEELITKYGSDGQETWDELGIDMSKDGKYVGEKKPTFNSQKILATFEGMPYQPAINYNDIISLTLNKAPTGRHVIFESSDSDSSDEAKISQSTRNNNKIDKKRSKKRKRKSESDSSDEKPDKKKHKKEKEKKKK